MTLGQRIAQKRKEQNLSQEALGEALGVSRQSIYKWESDSALPEIEKLVTLSRLFGVPVGWLLGVEEETASSREASDELTESQLKMVEAIAERYLAARPKPKHKNWLYTTIALAVLLGVFSLINRLDQINQQYHKVQMTVTHVQDSVDTQINSIASQVEDILKAQNSLTADYKTEVIDVDPESGTIKFSVYAIPKTYMEGMSAHFSADNGNGATIFPVDSAVNQKFSANLTCELTDTITLSVTFVSPDGTRETQILDTYHGKYSETLPYINLEMDHLVHTALKEPGLFTIPVPENKALGYLLIDANQDTGDTAIQTIRVGLFKNKELVSWASLCETPSFFVNFEGYDCFMLPPLEIQLTAEDELCWAAILTDEYGREVVCQGIPCILDETGESLTWPSGTAFDSDPNNWTY